MTNKMQRILAVLLTALILIAALPVSAVTEAAAPAAETLQSAEKAAKAKSVKVTGAKKMTVGETITLTAVVSPAGASQKVKWTSSDKSVATVSSKGVVTAKKAGKVTITAAARDGSKKKGKITITVKSAGTKYYALVVANWDYDDDDDDLAGPKWDARAMQAMLKGLSQKWKVKVVKNATASGMRSAIRTAFKGATEKDVCLFFYTGHGAVINPNWGRDEEQGALVGVDYTYLYGGSLASSLSQAAPGKVVVLLDSCGSGGMIYEKGKGEGSGLTGTTAATAAFASAMNSSFSYFDAQARDKAAQDKTGELLGGKFLVLTGCAYLEYSKELFTNDRTYGSGVFTLALNMALGFDHKQAIFDKSTMPADKNGDKKLTLQELYDGICDSVDEIREDVKKYDIRITQTIKVYGDADFIVFTR